MDDQLRLNGHSGHYRTVVVGTDGSATSMRAVDRAGAIAARNNARLVVASAHPPTDRAGFGVPPSRSRGIDFRDVNALGDGAYMFHGDGPTYEILHEARDRARAAGATDVAERAVVGSPVTALINLVEELDADLLVVGSVGLNTVLGRLLGSLPAGVSRKAKTDVLIVHTT